MKNKNLIQTIERQALTTEEAAFMIRVSNSTFYRRFVIKQKIFPVIYDEEQGDFLYDKDDVINLVKSSRRKFTEDELREFYKNRSKNKE